MRRGEEEKRRRGEEEKRTRGEEEKRRSGEAEKRKRRKGEENEEEGRGSHYVLSFVIIIFCVLIFNLVFQV